jgi:Spy/CpxP family protein refolding chaperone
MRKGRALALAAILALVGAFAGLAREPSTPSKKLVLPHFWNELGLAADQKQQIQAIQNQYREKFEQLRRQLRSLERREYQEMEKVLTDAQQARFRELKGEAKNRSEEKPADKEP